MPRTVRNRRQEAEHQIDRPFIDTGIVDRLFQPDEQADGIGDLRQPGMRNGDAIAKTCRTEIFALLKGGGDGIGIHAVARLRTGPHQRKQSRLAGDGGIGHHRLFMQPTAIVDQHNKRTHAQKRRFQ